MIRVSDIVKTLFLEDGFAVEAAQRGLLNTTAYAKEIQKDVEKQTMKPVQLGTIVVSLSRLVHDTQHATRLSPKVHITNFNVTSTLCEVTYEKTESTIRKLTTIGTLLTNGNYFLTVTEGLHEITIICTSELKEAIVNHFTVTPKIVINDLVAISVQFSSNYIEIPNTIYALVGVLATKHINVIEIVSTHTELSFIVYRKDMGRTVEALNIYSQKKID